MDIFCRGNLFTIEGPERTSRAARRLLQSLYRLSANEVLTPDVINLHLQESGMDELASESEEPPGEEITVKTKRGIVRGRGPNQKKYLRAISANAINFGVGPAGTGKTYLAVAAADQRVAALEYGLIEVDAGNYPYEFLNPKDRAVPKPERLGTARFRRASSGAAVVLGAGAAVRPAIF